MELLRFTVRNQKLSGGKLRIVSDSIDYVEAVFDFRTEDWSGLSKWAHFTKDETTYDVNLTDDKITRDMHLNLSVGTWEVKLHGTDAEGSMRITTGTAYVVIESYGNAENETPLPEIPLTVAEQIDAKSQRAFEIAQKSLDNSEEAVSKAQLVAEAAARGEFNGEEGEPGKTPEIQIGNVETLLPEANATISIGGTVERPIFNFGIPRGNTGEKGSRGASGLPGLEWKGEWNEETSYKAITADENGKLQVSRDVVFYNGSAYVCSINSTEQIKGIIPEDDKTGSWELLAKKGEVNFVESDNEKSEKPIAVDFTNFNNGIIVETYEDDSTVTYNLTFGDAGEIIKIIDSNGNETVLTW